MELDLLKRRAEKLLSSFKTRSRNFLDGEFRLIPGMNFTCSGTITSLLIGASYRAGGTRIRFPEVQLWRIGSGGNFYTRQAIQEIRLAAGDFSPDGVLQYNLTTPISFQSGDVLGVYQPLECDSLVTLFYNIDATALATLMINSNPTSSISLAALSPISDQKILISPLSGILCIETNIT